MPYRRREPGLVAGWRDILGQIIPRGVGATDPAWGQIGSSSLYAFNFSVLDRVWVAWHMPHDYVPGTQIYFHAHWLADGTDVNPVKWEWDFAYSPGFGTGVFNIGNTTVVEAAEPPAGVPYTHQVTESAGVTIPNLETDGMIYSRVMRKANGGTDNTDNIFLLTSDIHYESTDHATPYKRPNFYSGTPG